MSNPRTKVFSTIALVAAFMMQSSAPAAAAGDEAVLSGTVEINSTQIAFLISGKAGGGTLEYQGKEYPFGIAGLGVGGIGIQTLNAVGAVYNLDKLSDFSGVYTQVRAGVTLGSGTSYLKLGNAKGVTLDLRASTKGVALSLGVDGMVITLE